MTRVKLGQVAREYKGKASNEMAGSLPIVGLEHLSSGDIDLLGCDAPGETTFTKTFKEGHVLFGRRRAYLRKASIATFEGVCSGDIIVIEADENRLSSRLLPFIIQSDSLFDFAVENSAGSLSPRVKWQRLAEYEFDLPSLDEQEKLAEVLWAAQETKRKYRQLLEASDDIIKARFIEMFGDAESGVFGYDFVNLGSVLRKPASNGFFAKRADYVDNGNVGVLGVVDVVNRRYSKTDNLPRTNASEKDIEKYGLAYGDMLFCRSSLVLEGIGKASIVPEDVEPNTLFECHVIRMPLDTNVCVPEFMQVQSTMGAFRKQVMAKAKTATMTTIDQKSLLNTQVFIPPIEMQMNFLVFIKQIDKSKVELQKSLDDLNTMMTAILNEELGLQHV